MSDSQKDKFPTEGKSRPTFEGTRFDDADLQKIHTQLLREKEEPTENFSPMPLFLVAVFMILAFWAGVYLVRYSGDFGPFHYDETKAAGEGEEAGPREVDLMALGKRVYSQNCVACHQATGMGLPNVYPPLVDSDWVKDNPRRLIKIILSGLSGQVTVNGKDFMNAMTPFNRLSDQQIAAVLTYVRTDSEYGNNSHEVSEDMVAEVRSEYGSRTDPWSQAELEEIDGPVTGEWEPPAGEQSEAEEGEEPAEDQESKPEAESSEDDTTEGDSGEQGDEDPTAEEGQSGDGNGGQG